MSPLSLRFSRTRLTSSRPTTQVNRDTGEESPASETWIWILISRPIVCFDADDTATNVPAESPNPDSTASTMFYTPYQVRAPPGLAQPSNIHPRHPTPPPNFPHPIPNSWLVFAAPLAHITSYPEAIENVDGIQQPTSAYPFATNASKRIHKRLDYDFSFSGIPLFEFSSSELFSSTAKMDFLSVEDIGGWCENDRFQEYSTEEYKRIFSLWEDGEWITSGEEGGDGEDGRGPMPAPNRGAWWKEFYKRMYEDSARWGNVKKAMGRGKCRIVVRWAEMDVSDEAMTFGPGGVMGAAKCMVPVGKSKGAQGKRQTRSETRRRSALGVGDASVGATVGGVVALGESSKSRATGNREMGRGAGGAGGAGDKEKKIRKR